MIDIEFSTKTSKMSSEKTEEDCYGEIYKICKVLFTRDLDLNLGGNIVLMTEKEKALNRAKQMIFWQKIKPCFGNDELNVFQRASISLVDEQISLLNQDVRNLSSFVRFIYAISLGDPDLRKNILGKKCSNCEKLPPEGTRYKCTECNMFYCNRKCQLKDWRKYHKGICNLIPKYFLDLYNDDFSNTRLDLIINIIMKELVEVKKVVIYKEDKESGKGKFIFNDSEQSNPSYCKLKIKDFK